MGIAKSFSYRQMYCRQWLPYVAVKASAFFFLESVLAGNTDVCKNTAMMKVNNDGLIKC